MTGIMEVDYSVTPATITSNYDSVLQWLGNELDRYDVVVTDDTVTESRKMCAELNKMRATLKTIKKDAVAKVSEPIKAFEAQMKALDEMCEEGRQKLLGQIDKFDQEKMGAIKVAITEFIWFQYSEQNLDDKYRKVNADSFLKLSAVTSTGNLTGATQRAIIEAVSECADKQDRYKARVARLASVSVLAGLKSPITEDDARHFLDAESESDYDASLNTMVEKLKSREQEAVRLQDSPPAESSGETSTKVAPPENVAPAAPEEALRDGKTNISVACVFKTTVKVGVTDEKIEAELRKVLKKAGITTLHSVHITRTA